MSKIRTEISIETNESFVVKRRRYSTRGFCSFCGRLAIFVLPTEAGFLAGLDVDTIVSHACTGELHIYRVPDRGTYICLTSLCLMNHSSSTVDHDDLFEQTELSNGLQEPGLILNDLRKL